jgi:eukaryotic-like serine/threonine-protein kinase
MDPARWQRIERLYHAALARPRAERAAFLEEACAGDEDVQREVEALLDAPATADGLFAVTALGAAVPMVTDPTASVLAGRRLGVYHLQERIGIGGMGEVYRARDTRLGRDVAIKILPHALTTDRERLTRLEREAHVLAALNHPYIAAIYGIEESDGIRALVLELVEGETLAARIGRGALPVNDALALGRQLAEALEAAHEKGIIHRDLKPSNLMITTAGAVKVLDFGLAKVALGDGAESHAPTLTPDYTLEGMILGTAAYMSPEQARGQVVDKRTDIWAFGCVLYEMLSGRTAFSGGSISDTIAAILEREPDWSALPQHAPAGIRQLLRRCLDKDRKRRLHDIADARIEIDEIQSASPVVVAPSAPRRHGRLTWILGLAAVTLTAAAIAAWVLRPASMAPEARLEINTPPTRDPSLAISPDGLKIVFVARSASGSQLWLRSLDSPAARPLAGTERATLPFWSPDNRAIGFFADGKLKRMDIDGGSAKTLVPVSPVPLGGAWNSDGTIVFSSNPGRPILRVSAAGSEPVAVTRFEPPQQRTQSSPQFLPDQRHFLFFVTGSMEARGIYVGQLDSLDTKRLFDADSPAVYAATGYLLFIRERKLLAQDFDPVRLETRGDPFPITEDMTGGTTLDQYPQIVMSASAAGPIVYRMLSADSGQRQLVWVDRSGSEIERIVYPDTQAQGPSLSRDGRRIAVFRHVNGNTDIWSYETGRRAWDRITFDSGDDIYPLWSADARSVVFASRRGPLNLYLKLLSAPPGSEDMLLSTSQGSWPMDWSADGRFLLYDSPDPKRGWDIWALPLDGERKPSEVIQTDFNERLGQFSPDGKWIAYQSDKTGRFEIYARPFQSPGSDSPVSTDGGTQVRWNPNGKELFYVARDDRLMAVPIRFDSSGQTMEAGVAVGLFATNVGSTAINTNRQQYMVTPDGQSFVMNSVPEQVSASPVTVILNWKPR